MGDYFFLNGEVIRSSEARILVYDLALLRGYGLFDFFRTFNKKPFLMDRYLDRFWNSAKHLGLKIPFSRDKLPVLIHELLEKNHVYEAGIRMILTGGYTLNGYLPGEPNFFILIEKITFPDEEKYKQGIKLYFYEYQRELSHIKSINYLIPIYLRDKILQDGAFDVLYHAGGKVLEVSRSNIFLIKDGILITPVKGVLAGITRATVIRLAKEICKVEEREVSVEELWTADETFMTGTTKRVLPVVQIGRQKIGSGTPGPLTRQLMGLYSEFENSTNY